MTDEPIFPNFSYLDAPSAAAAIRKRGSGCGRVAWIAMIHLGLWACSPLGRGESAFAGPEAIRQRLSIGSEPLLVAQWESETRSPRESAVDQDLTQLQQLCGRPDAALASVATRLAKIPGFGARVDDPDRLSFALRASGSPYVWPRAWSLVLPGHRFNPELVSTRFSRWLRTFNDGGERRCGLARLETAEDTVFAAVASDVVADILSPLPTRARTGQWLDLRVRLLSEASDAKVILEGPSNEPIVVPASLSHGEVRSRFPMSGPGAWLVQVLATMSTGPRPVAEAEVFVDEEPPRQPEKRPAPGESAGRQAEDPTEALYLMLNGSRVKEGRKSLPRDRRLDRLATEHAQAMLAAGHIGHDVGDGSPKFRLENAGIFAALAGENVAHAADAARAHRAFWASPSHRSNILHRGFRNVGLAVIRGPDGTVWACELFAALD